MLEDAVQPRVNLLLLNHQHDFAIEFVAGLAAIQATHRGPMSISYPHKHQFGMDAAGLLRSSFGSSK